LALEKDFTPEKSDVTLITFDVKDNKIRKGNLHLDTPYVASLMDKTNVIVGILLELQGEIWRLQ